MHLIYPFIYLFIQYFRIYLKYSAHVSRKSYHFTPIILEMLVSPILVATPIHYSGGVSYAHSYGHAHHSGGVS